MNFLCTRTISRTTTVVGVDISVCPTHHLQKFCGQRQRGRLWNLILSTIGASKHRTRTEAAAGASEQVALAQVHLRRSISPCEHEEVLAEIKVTKYMVLESSSAPNSLWLMEVVHCIRDHHSCITSSLQTRLVRRHLLMGLQRLSA